MFFGLLVCCCCHKDGKTIVGSQGHVTAAKTISLLMVWDSAPFEMWKKPLRGVVSSFWDVEARCWGLWCPDRRPHSWGHTGHTGKQPPPLLIHLLPPPSSFFFCPFSRPARRLLFPFSLCPLLPLFFLLLLLFPFFSPSSASKWPSLANFEICSHFFLRDWLSSHNPRFDH